MSKAILLERLAMTPEMPYERFFCKCEKTGKTFSSSKYTNVQALVEKRYAPPSVDCPHCDENHELEESGELPQ